MKFGRLLMMTPEIEDRGISSEKNYQPDCMPSAILKAIRKICHFTWMRMSEWIKESRLYLW